MTALLRKVFSKGDVRKISDVIEADQGSKRVKPDFGTPPENTSAGSLNMKKNESRVSGDDDRGSGNCL